MYKYLILEFRPDSNITDGPVDRCKEKDFLTTFRSQGTFQDNFLPIPALLA